MVSSCLYTAVTLKLSYFLMKKFLLSLLALLTFSAAYADEGMWLLKLMKEQHLEDSLKKAGLQISPSELYNETQPSLRDVIGRFGNGCTGEVVSSKGLVFTNNHCGFSYVHAMSSIKHNYLQEGFFAQKMSEELPVPDLTFTFVVSIVDVTAQVETEAKKAKVDEYYRQSNLFLRPLADKMLKKNKTFAKKRGVTLRIVPYFGGNRYYAFYEQRYDDVRLVVNPPQQVAQFGFNQDNWVWPRHNADFAVFRIYADAKGQPAAYSKNNLPLECKKWLPVSLKGIGENDYTMIMGFPGRTSRYLTASQVRLRTESINEPINLAGDAELRFMKALMDSNKDMALKYANDYMGLGNMVKNFGGMNASVRSTGLLNIKAEEEKRFRAFAAQSGKPEYVHIIDRMDSLVAAVKDTLHDYNLLRFTFGAQDFKNDRNAVATVDKAYDLGKMKLLSGYWAKYHKLALQPEFVSNDMATYFDALYQNSLFADSAKLKTASAEALGNDVLATHWATYRKALSAYQPAVERYEKKVAELNRIYVRGLCEMYDWTKSPDANSTLRMTYGHIKGYAPRDAVRFDWKTTLRGMFEKENPTDPDYVVDEKLRQHYLTKNYGQYANAEGELPTCFLSNNDITGGNSGSAVLNARGELIGLAFDGNIESLSSDLRFNPTLQRCINADIRYILFVIDTYGGSKYLIDEMEIRK